MPRSRSSLRSAWAWAAVLFLVLIAAVVVRGRVEREDGAPRAPVSEPHSARQPQEVERAEVTTTPESILDPLARSERRARPTPDGEPPARLVVRVADERGAPVSGLEIERHEIGRRGGTWTPVPRAVAALEGGASVLTLDPDSIRQRETRVGAPGCVWLEFAADAIPTDGSTVVLRDAGRIVASFGNLVPGDRWTLFVERADRSSGASLRDSRRSMRGNAADFRREKLVASEMTVDRLPPGDYRVSAALANDVSLASADVRVEAGAESAVTLELPRVEAAAPGSVVVRVTGSGLAALARQFPLRLEVLADSPTGGGRAAVPIAQFRVPPDASVEWTHRFPRLDAGEYAITLHPIGLRATAHVAAGAVTDLALDSDALTRTAVSIYSGEDGRPVAPRRVTGRIRTPDGVRWLEPASGKDSASYLFVSPVGDLAVACEDDAFAISPSWSPLSAGWNAVDVVAVSCARVRLHAPPELARAGADPFEGVSARDPNGRGLELGRSLDVSSGELDLVLPARVQLVISWAARATCTPPDLRLRLEPGSIERREVSCAGG